MIDKTKLLELIEAIATYSDAEEVELDIANGRRVTKREARMAKALNRIYMFVHGQGKCQHPDWQKEAREIYSNFVKNGLF